VPLTALFLAYEERDGFARAVNNHQEPRSGATLKHS